MKLIVIGDTHGRDAWKQVLEKEKQWDKFVFIGDYFDTRDGVQAQDQCDNFIDILSFKKENPDDVILLLGNHDFHYLTGTTDQYSQFDFSMYEQANRLLMGALERNLIQLVYKQGKYLFSHAGVSEDFLKTWEIKNDESLVDELNKLLEPENLYKLEFGVNLPREMFPSNTGDNTTQSPIWIRPTSLLHSKLENYIHVAGHTQVTEIQLVNDILLIDILGTVPQYIVIENEDFEIKDI